MKKNSKVIFRVVLILSLIAVFTGCASKTPTAVPPTAAPTAAPTEVAPTGAPTEAVAPTKAEVPVTGGAAAETKALKVGIVTSSGVDDGSFGEDCYNGILDFIKTSPESTVTHVKEPDVSKMIQAVADIITDYDAIVLPGFQFAAVGTVAQENPNTKLILVDTPPTDAEGNTVELPNVYSMTFKEEEGGFFAGIAAAMETKTNKVAVVNGLAYPSNVNYQWGFESGVNYANAKFGTKAEIVELPSYAGTDVTGKNVGGNYIGGFADEVTGKVVGKALIDKGVDIIFVAAGASGNGVFTAIKEANGVYAIGCDVDQFDDGVKGDGSNMILTSTLKVMHTNVTKQLQAIADGTFVGKNEVLGASTDSTGYVSAEGRQQLSADTLAKLAEVYQLVKEGKIVPAANFNGYTPEDFPGLK
ncbi:MAG TPA: BMP family ABC transporter substrate-binding protein [Flexilinea sp.]|nr:BMP family ABC transporter substrate-binding protein [Flexilinea sp.]